MDSQILAILKQAENGVPVPELCREYGMSSPSICYFFWGEITYERSLNGSNVFLLSLLFFYAKLLDILQLI